MNHDDGNGRSEPGRWFSGMRRHRFDILLVALTLLLLSAPVVHTLRPLSHPVLAGTTVTVLFSVMLLSAVFAVCQSRRTVVVALSLAVPTIILQAIGVSLRWDGIVIPNHVLGISFLAYSIVLIIRFLFVNERITANMIWASLCVYLLMGVLWAEVYSLIYVLDHESFVFVLAQDDQNEARLMRFGEAESIYPLYYSFVTMTTLGYGDIVPTSAVARMLAAIQAVMGQLYLAVLVARLVGLHIVWSTTRKDREDASPGAES